MVQLIAYTPQDEGEILKRMVDFFGFHAALVGANGSETDTQLLETLKEWLREGSVLYMILEDGIIVGFLRIGFRGEIAAWIEDIYVDPSFRGKDLAAEAIRLAEEIVRNTPNYTAVCFDVAPRNSAAMELYYRLGYRDLSMITLRKEFGESRRDKPLSLLGRDLHY